MRFCYKMCFSTISYDVCLVKKVITVKSVNKDLSHIFKSILKQNLVILQNQLSVIRLAKQLVLFVFLFMRL